MMKYRIRLDSGRVIGPFDKNQLFDLKAKDHIKGFEEAQIFPTGNWVQLCNFDFYPELMDEKKTKVLSQEKKEETFVIDLTELRNLKNEKEIDELDQGTRAPVQHLTETMHIEQKSRPNINVSVSNPEPEIKLDLGDVSEAFEIDYIDEGKKTNLDHTVLNPVAQLEIEKLHRNQKKAEEKKISEENARRLAQEHAKELELQITLDNEPVSADELTQMHSIDKAELMEIAFESEKVIDKEFRAVLRQEKLDADLESEESGTETTGKSKKKKIILVVAALAVIYAFMFPDEKNKNPTFRHLEPKIVFPIPFDQSEPKKAKVLYNQGLEFLTKGTYPNLIKAGLSFKESYENDIGNLQALSLIVRTYAEQLKHSKNKLKDAQTVFNIIQSKRAQLIQDPNGVVGMNLFYMAIDKQDAAIDVVQKYLKIRPKAVIEELFAVYVMSLTKQGKIDVASTFVKALKKIPQKNRYSYTALIEYFLLNQEYEQAMEYVDEAIKNHPKIVYFLLLKSDLLMNQDKPDAILPFIKKAEKMNLEYNDHNRAKLFELKGLYYLSKTKPDKAIVYLTKSLKLNDSDELRMKLAALDSSENKTDATKIINESKAVKFNLQARELYYKGKFQEALSAAAKATDIYPGHIPSEIFFSKIQMRLGLTKQSLNTLETLVQKYPDDRSIDNALVEAYIQTYKFNDAKNRLQNIANPAYRDSFEYASLNAKLHLRMGDSLQAMSWLKNSISINPLNDTDIFALAEILLKKANFDAARQLLDKCMELDPVNPDYRIAYARLIYETKDDRAATGFLLSLRDDFGDNAKVLSEIAIFYYRSGRVKDFLDAKAMLEKNFSTDRSLYDFLIKAALLDDRISEIPALVEKLLKIEPGDLEAMMTAGRVLFEEGKLDAAAKWFDRVRAKLPSYPKVLYFLARIDFQNGHVENAEKKIKENMKANGENDDDLVFLAEIHANKEEFIEAENLYKRAQKINARSYDAILGLADLSTKRNNHDLALDLYTRAMKLKSDEPLVHKKIGDVYRQLGQGTLAIEAYRLYLEMEPESPHRKNLEAYINLMK